MDNIKQWFRNLRKPAERFSPVEYHEKAIAGYCSPSMREYHEKEMRESMPEEIKSLKACLARSLRERKTCTREDFHAQLASVLDANSAVAHQKLLGVNENSEISKIIRSNYSDEVGKLMFLVFEDIALSEDEIEAAVKKYREQD